MLPCRGLSRLLEVLQRRDDEELLDEELRVEDGDVGGAADEGVGVGGEGVVDVVAGEGGALGAPEDRADQVVHHLLVRHAWNWKGS